MSALVENPYRSVGTYAGVSYVEREADVQLIKEIRENRLFPFFLAPRQSGKSSLITRTINKLAGEYQCVFIDLSTLTPESLENYDQFLLAFNTELLAAVALANEIKLDSNLRRIIGEVTERADKRIVIFVDEVDQLLNVKFKDSFFGLIRFFFNQRVQQPKLKNVQFVLAGAALPTQLISKENQSPFNVGRLIRLDDLTAAQVEGMLEYLRGAGVTVEPEIHSAIFQHTKGSVYLTQLILERAWDLCVQGHAARLFVDDIERLADSVVVEASDSVHFLNIYSGITSRRDMLQAFRAYADGDSVTPAVLEFLRITGITGTDEVYRNPIYRRIFGPGGPLSLFNDANSAIAQAEKDKRKKLNLSGQSLTTLSPEIGNLTNLTHLYLSGNRLFELPSEIWRLSNLQHLDISHNQLATLPREIKELHNLESLDIKNNQLISIPPEIKDLKKLSTLDLRGNPLPVPMEVLTFTNEPDRIINSYFKQATRQRRTLNEAKLLVVGQGGVGKTSLVHSLLEGNYDPREDKTEGVDVWKWYINANDEWVRLNVWDFGGQEIMHATHQFFLTKRSLYVLVLDARSDEEENRVEYWLKIIQSFGKDSPVVVVGNKIDQQPFDIHKRGLQAKYPNIKAFVETSCRSGRGIEELKTAIAREVLSLEHVHDQFPTGWLAVKSSLEETKDYITYQEYIRLCLAEGIIDKISQDALISLLHDLGIILNFHGGMRLEETIILDPEWVTNGVYKILNSHTLFQNKGVLERAALSQILDPQKYPKDKQLVILDMMRKFELCFDFEDERDVRFLIPDLLPKEEPDTGNWDEALAFQYDYNVLPSSIISRFIVRMHEYISMQKLWRTGVVLKSNGNKALVKADLEERKIFVWVGGREESRRRFLEVIRSQFDSIHQTIPGIVADEKVPLPAHPNIAVDYKHLLRLELKGIEEWIPEGLEEEVNVRRLLNGIETERSRSRRERYEGRTLEISETLSETLANGTDLDAWSNRLDARGVLPKLLLRLAYATGEEIEHIEFPSEEATQVGGWDGILKVTAGNEFIPAGRSAWELSTNRDVKGKANSDYEKRKANPLGLTPGETTFVFVTLRRWGGKDRWVEARRGEGFWRDVRAYDVDDLAAWLERAPGVLLWLSILIGKHPEGARDISNFWDGWADVTEPRMSADLVLSGRQEEVDHLFSWLRTGPSTLALQADSREEALAFFAAALERLPQAEREPSLARSIVVEDVVSWRHLTASGKPLILIPSFNEREFVARAVKQGHHVLIPIGQDEPGSSATVTIPRIKRDAAKQALVGMGIQEERADDLATLARRSLMALRRKLAISPEVQQPAWAKPAEARKLLPAIMVGAWNDTLAGDREVIAKLARTPYEEFNEMLAQAVHLPDPPIRRVGDVWLLASKEDSWSLLGKYLTREDLENFEGVVLDVLGQPDPSFDLPVDERYMANILGKTLPYSGLLREGLAETLALMGAHSDSLTFADATTGQQRADRIVGSLLHKANTDWRLWASLAYRLPLLAEAAPGAFLDAVERGLSGETPVLLNIFSEGKNTLFSSSPHTGLLWALERVAWHPEYLGHAASLLAKLARLDPGGKLVNRPSRSLHEIFLCWYPQTTASLSKRLSVLDSIREREPQVAWALLNTLLPEAHGGTAFPTAKPQWREWAPDTPPQVTYAELFQAEREIVSRLLMDVGTDGRRWRDLIFKVDDVSKEQHDSIVESLLTLDVGSFTAEDRILVWDALRDVISRHREFPDAKWAMPKEMVDRLQQAYDRFQPEDLISRHAGLFAQVPKLLSLAERDWHARHDALEAARLEAVLELHAQGSLALLLDFAGRVERPGEVGLTVGKSGLIEGEEDELLGQKLGSAVIPENLFARGFVTGRLISCGWDWVDSKLTSDAVARWSPEQQADFLASLSFEARTWDLLETMDDETERLYWSRVPTFGLPNRADSERAALKLIEHGRPHVAIDFIALYRDEEGPAVPPNVIARALERLLEVLNESTVDLSSIGYDITRLLNRLAASDEIDESRVASLEWAYLPVIQNYGGPKVLHRELSRNPDFFAEVVSLVYKGEGEERQEVTEEAGARARLGYELLNSWRSGPACREDGSFESNDLRDWVSRARESLRERGRGVIGDQTIGGTLVRTPPDPDGAWPHAAVRDLIEELASEELERGIEIGVYNSRGVFMKSQTEGGLQERQLAERYQGYANQIGDRWHRTAAMLRRIARSYISDARREDINAELTEDLWR